MKKSEIRLILRKIGLIPQKKHGQNFLASDKIAEQIAAALHLQPGDFAIEIGPGLGMVTGKLLATGARILAVEIDKKLAAYLEKRFAGNGNFNLIEQDFLMLDPNTLRSNNGSRNTTFITNPPYRGAKKILKRLVSMKGVRQIVVTLQKEVAQAVLSLPGTKNANALSYIVRYRFTPQKLFDIPQNFFYPEPTVNSTTLILKPHKPKSAAFDETFYVKAVEQLMHIRKRHLRNSIRAAFGIPQKSIDSLLSQIKLEGTMRSTELSIAQMVQVINGINRIRTE